MYNVYDAGLCGHVFHRRSVDSFRNDSKDLARVLEPPPPPPSLPQTNPRELQREATKIFKSLLSILVFARVFLLFVFVVLEESRELELGMGSLTFKDQQMSATIIVQG